MTDFNVFDGADSQQRGEFFKFAEVGDEVQGTYIDRFESVNRYQQAQVVYVLEDKDGKIWNCGFGTSKTILHNKMATASIGEYVGFRFDSKKPARNFPGKDTHIINAYPSGKMNEEWLAKRNLNTPSALTPTSVPVTAKPMGTGIATVPDSPALKAVRDLARKKGLVPEDTDDESTDTAIAVHTGLELSEPNLTNIILKLSSFGK